MYTGWAMFLAAGLICVVISPALALKPVATRDEMKRARRWTKAHFEPVRASGAAVPVPAVEPKPGLLVLENHDRIVQNRRPDGVPIKIGKAVFERGLLCHAVSNVMVRLPGPGKTFTSIVGIHADAGGGSVIFSVKVKGREAFRSSIVHCGDEGVPVSVDLGGARELALKVGDAGDGITCDQSDWADAKVTLMDGREVWLGDMPIITPEVRARTASIPPFSFIYGGRSSDGLLGAWDFKESTKKLDTYRTQRTQTYTDPQTGLEMRCVLVEYNDYPILEWTLYFKNTGKKDTPILEDILALDTWVRRGASSEFVLHHNVGTPYSPQDYQPLTTALGPAVNKKIGATGGRPLNTDMPYFNVEWGGEGMIIALGWPGQWTASFLRDAADGLRIVGGQENTRFKLLPGEEVRGPLTAIQFWQAGDVVRSQNIWRRWMIAHSLPRPGGQPMPPVISLAGADFFPNLIDSVADEITLLDGAVREKFDFDYWWRDAGWYACGDTWVNTGTWEPDPVRYPRGLRELADVVHANGDKFTVWFEPERVTSGSWLAENHPEWILGGKSGGLLNLGNPDAWNWVVNHIDKLITENGIDMYRQDFNMDPLSSWRGNDAEDRQGITENHHVRGLLAYWDELARRHPRMPIDCCASGGRRNELEEMRRGVPLSKTDYFGGATSSQCQFYGIAPWLPYFGAGTMTHDLYNMRSNIAPWSASAWDTRNSQLDFGLVRKYLAECRKVAPYYWGDFYPLTPYSLAENVWMAWQFDMSAKGRGVVQAFRRPENPDASAIYRLNGLDPEARYLLTDFDAEKPRSASGRELMEKGLTITATKRPWAVIITYEKLK